MNNLLKTLKENKWQILILLLTVLIGLAIRLKGLGKWPLAVDEYYIIKSVENILQKGIPEWSSGGLYLRGLIFQYMIAGLLILGIKVEFAARRDLSALNNRITSSTGGRLCWTLESQWRLFP